jgi:hypothetical protein
MIRWMLALTFVGFSTIPASAQTGSAKRPALLMPLYVSQVALQGADLHSTFSALDRGHREGNPLFRNENRAKMIGAKIAVTCVPVVLAEKLWKKNRAAAIAVMVTTNAALSFAVANNYRLAYR